MASTWLEEYKKVKNAKVAKKIGIRKDLYQKVHPVGEKQTNNFDGEDKEESVRKMKMILCSHKPISFCMSDVFSLEVGYYRYHLLLSLLYFQINGDCVMKFL